MTASPRVYLAPLHRAETAVADALRALAGTPAEPIHAVEAALAWLTETQRCAVRMALRNRLSVLTGLPGAGKTTTLKAIVDALGAARLSVELAAPTGKAAKRMEQQIGRPARTIHRLLEYHPEHGWRRNQGNPLDADMVILDEMSMADLPLARHLCAAINPKRTRVLLVGDVHQLPPVGPGAPLADLIRSGICPVTRLTEILRQDDAGDIVLAAHAIHRGEMPRDGADDFRMILHDSPELTRGAVLDVVGREAAALGIRPNEIQVLSPMKTGLLGTKALGAAVGAVLNPTGRKLPGLDFSLGDRVIHTRNNYKAVRYSEASEGAARDLREQYGREREPARREALAAQLERAGAEVGIFNGETGTVIQHQDGALRVRFDDGFFADYPDGLAREELMPAWALTIHRAQGSEYPAVVVVLHQSHFIMLARNLIYTAVTRGARFVWLVGSGQAIRTAIRNNRAAKRNTGLAERLVGQKDVTHSRRKDRQCVTTKA